MNMVLVAGTLPYAPLAMGDGGLLYLAIIAVAGAVLVGTGAVMTRKHAPRSCPVRRHHYAAGPR